MTTVDSKSIEENLILPVLNGIKPQDRTANVHYVKSLLQEHKTSDEKHRKETRQQLIAILITILDEKIKKLLGLITSNSRYLELKSLWLSLHQLTFLAPNSNSTNKTKVKLLNCSWSNLKRSLIRAADIEQNDFYKLIYRNEFDTPGGEPFGIIVSDFYIASGQKQSTIATDIEALKSLSQICAAAFSPFILGVAPNFFGVDKFSQLASITNLSEYFSHPQRKSWQQLRMMEDSRFIGLVLPSILLQKERENTQKGYENLFKTQNNDLWGNASFTFASVVINSFVEYGWFSDIRGYSGTKNLKGLVSHSLKWFHSSDTYLRNSFSNLDLVLSDKLEHELSNEGFIPLTYQNLNKSNIYFSNNSVFKSPVDTNNEALANIRLTSMLQYTLCVSRVAHYIKIMFRNKVGSYLSADQCQNTLQSWLNKYTSASENSSEEVKSRFPLKSAIAQVTESQSRDGKYYAKLYLQPHFQFDHLNANIRLITELTHRN